MDKVPNADRYPIPQDDRLTDTIIGLVADLLHHHGFPPVFARRDLKRLRDAISAFLYGPLGSDHRARTGPNREALDQAASHHSVPAAHRRDAA